MRTSPLRIERSGDIAIVRFCRPEVHNAMNASFIAALASAVEGLAADASVRAIVFTGNDRAFSAGGDLASISGDRRGAPAAVRDLAGKLHETIVRLRRMPKPVIAAIGGVAAGAGMSLALACDLRVMGRSARMVLAYTSRGLSVDGGASFSLPRLIGLARSLELVALDEPISAERALAWGLATRVVGDDEVLDAALALARRVAKRSVHAFGAAKRLLVDSFGATLEEQLARETEALARSAAHPDGAEGLAAFRGKRSPVFRAKAKRA
jgi:2-(1,2-epoxy-1,2-dihydrophenyl)acetyl-CoA isomerase